MLKKIYFQFTLPDRDECIVGFSTTPWVEIGYRNEETDEIVEQEDRSLFSIGLLFLRIDILI